MGGAIPVYIPKKIVSSEIVRFKADFFRVVDVDVWRPNGLPGVVRMFNIMNEKRKGNFTLKKKMIKILLYTPGVDEGSRIPRRGR